MPEACPTLERACARLEGRGRPRNAALMLRDASQRASAVGAAAFAFHCDAPQHEGEGRSTNLRLSEMIADSVRLFRVVIYKGERNSSV